MAKKTGLGKGIVALFNTDVNELENEREMDLFDKIEEQEKEKEEKVNIKNNEIIKEQLEIKIEKPQIKEKNNKESKEYVELKLIDIEPNKNQARKYFDERKILELSESIKTFGVIQPIVVVKKDGYYQIVAGERRWRASKLAGLKTIPAIIKEEEVKDNEISIIENIQRENLNPIEKAKGYKKILEQYELTIADLAKKIGKSPSHVGEVIRYLQLDPRVIELAEKGEITDSACQALMLVEDGDIQFEMALYIIEDGLTIEEARKRLRLHSKKKRQKNVLDPMFREIEEKFSSCFGTKAQVKVNAKNANKGQIILKYNSNQDLERMLDLLSDLI